MNLNEFIDAVDNLVREWATEPDELGQIMPRDQLSAIWEQVRNGAAFDLARMQRERDEALRQLHSFYINKRERKT